MSTVKIKTEPEAAVDLQVKLEPSLSTADIKLEQYSSDTDTKVESDSETDSERNVIKSESDEEDNGDTDQDQFTIIPKKQRQWICKHPGCGRSFNLARYLRMHQHEHKLQTELYIYGNTYTLTRQSLNDRWPCPIPDCTSTFKTVGAIRSHLRACHGDTVRQQKQHSPGQVVHRNFYFADVGDFYVNGIHCGYHTTTGVFICHECRLVPESMLTHLQQKHGYNGKSIDSSVLPENAVSASTDPNVNQYTSNSYLASAIGQPDRQWHQDIIQGWLCETSECGYFGYTPNHRSDHRRRSIHKGQQFTTVPALVLRLAYAKAQASRFFITRIDQVTASSGNGVNRHKLDYSHDELNAKYKNGEDIDQNDTTDASNQKQQWKCEYHNCGLVFNASNQLRTHWREHKLEAVVKVRGTPFTLTRQSADDRWACPIPECGATHTKIRITHMHIINAHKASLKQKRANCEDDGDNSQQKPIIKKAKRAVHFLNVSDFYIGGTRYGYHTTTGVFICYECQLVPECLQTHLQEKHGYDEKSIDNSIIPNSAVSAHSDPNANQHINNSDLISAIREQNQLHYHPDIFQGWLCTASDCGYCCLSEESRKTHQYTKHRGEQTMIVPALVLRLFYERTQTSCFLITRLDTVTNNCEPSHSAIQYKSECDIDDGDELVLSDYSD